VKSASIPNPQSVALLDHLDDGAKSTLPLFTRYRARLVFRDKVLGGVPKDPRLIEGWLRARRHR
jgi:hypothetical protein